MKHAIWIILGCFGLSAMTALSARFGIYHIVPDFALIVTVFLALRREPVPMTLAVVALGYFSGSSAMAPTGLHEMGLLFVALWVYRGSGSFGGSGSFFFGLLCAGMLCVYHVFLFGMLTLIRGDVGFSSWATALLLPAASVTGLVATVFYRPMTWIESWVAPTRQVGLSWR